MFVLREVFDFGVRRDRGRRRQDPGRRTPDRAPGPGHVDERRPRAEATPGERDRVLERFMRAASTGDLQSLIDVLAPDVVLITDGGGVKKAALRPILGVRQGAAVPRRGRPPARADAGRRGRQRRAGAADRSSTASSTRSSSFVVEAGLVTGLYVVRNPAKLARLDAVVALTR